MRIISINLRQKWFIISETWQSILNNLLWEWLHYSFIRKREEILLESIKELQKKERDKMSNLKCWKSKDILSSRWIFKEIWWQVETLRNRAKKETNETDKSYIALIRVKSHLWFETDSMMTCINKRLRKASWIRKAEEKISSRTVTECIKSINKLMSANWAKFRRR